MNFKRATRFAAAAALLFSCAAQAANRLEGEWLISGCRLLANPNQTCETRNGAKIVFGPDSIVFYIAGAFDRRDDGVRYVDVGNRTEVYKDNHKEAVHVFESANRMFIDSPTQRFFFERVAPSQSAALAAPSRVPYGIWKASHCEYYKDGTLLPARECNLKTGMKVSVLPDRFVVEADGKTPHIGADPVYKEFPKWVEVQMGTSSDRLYTDEPGFISVLTKTAAPDVNVKLYFTKIESVAPPAPPAVSAPAPILAQPAPAAAVPARELRISNQERVQLLREMGMVLRGKQWHNECDRPVNPRLDVVDLNGDGQAEVFIIVSDSLCYGNAGSNLVLYMKEPAGHWQAKMGFPAGGYTLLKTRRGGFPDIGIDLPGACAPIWGWNGSKYDLVRKCPG